MIVIKIVIMKGEVWEQGWKNKNFQGITGAIKYVYSLYQALLTLFTVAVLWMHLVNCPEGDGGEAKVEEKNGLFFSPLLRLGKISLSFAGNHVYIWL